MTTTLDRELEPRTQSSQGARDRPALVAVDLGAESCRVSLLRWLEGEPKIQIVHRFANTPLQDGKSLRWDILRICDGVEAGLRLCAEIATEGIASIGVDGWAVDYVRLNAAGEPIARPFCYRDERTVEAQKEVHKRISSDRIYSLTGGQILPFNTVYQLYADGAEQLDQAIPWVNLPEFVLSRLGGKRVSEFTSATHTALLGLADKQWCPEIFDATGLDIAAAPPVVAPGSTIGYLKGPLASLPAFHKTRLITPACHDTASAIAGIPAHGDDWAFISSGTWSLVGAVLDSPCASETALRKNYSNEGGVGGKTYFVKNVNGLWLIQQCIEHWKSLGQVWTAEKLMEACEGLPVPSNLFEVDDPDLLSPGNMPGRINAQLQRTGKPSIAEDALAAPQLANLIFHSLAARYAAVLQDIAVITGKKLRRLFIVGGGSKNVFLNRLAAKATGLAVQVGATESSTIGNFSIQLAVLAGNFAEPVGVTSTNVAEWAGILTQQPFDVNVPVSNSISR